MNTDKCTEPLSFDRKEVKYHPGLLKQVCPFRMPVFFSLSDNSIYSQIKRYSYSITFIATGRKNYLLEAENEIPTLERHSPTRSAPPMNVTRSHMDMEDMRFFARSLKAVPHWSLIFWQLHLINKFHRFINIRSTDISVQWWMSAGQYFQRLTLTHAGEFRFPRNDLRDWSREETLIAEDGRLEEVKWY